MSEPTSFNDRIDRAADSLHATIRSFGSALEVTGADPIEIRLDINVSRLQGGQ